MANLKYILRINCFGMYNCGMAIFSNMEIRRADNSYAYAEPEYLIEHKDALINEFLEYLNCPPNKDPKSVVKGVIAHYVGNTAYTRLPFYVFHDNVKGDLVDKKNPFTDLSALMSYLYHNQKKYGITVTRSHMSDNYYHTPKGSHPGRVYVLTPPAFPAFVEGTKLTPEYKKGVKKCLDVYSNQMHPEDVATLKSLL